MPSTDVQGNRDKKKTIANSLANILSRQSKRPEYLISFTQLSIPIARDFPESSPHAKTLLNLMLFVVLILPFIILEILN